MDNLKIIIAGPGAGKTFNLKNEVINSLQNHDKNRFCAVITYTNAATDELRKRIASDIPIPPNVFIGTIHSFLIRFIIEPFGHLVREIEMPLEKNYIDNPLVELHENFGHVTQKALKTIPGIEVTIAKDIINILKKKWLCSAKGNINKNFRLNDRNFKINLPLKYSKFEKDIIKTIKENCVFKSEKRAFEIKRRCSYLAEILSKNGIISYDTVVGISSRIISENPSILKTISNRLKLLFIDEYQDLRLYIHEIFKAILFNNKTDITCFGDPLQEVFMFSYHTSHLKDEKPPENFTSTPMKELQTGFSEKVNPKIDNHRSSENIVKFLNEYFLESQFKQTSKNGDNGIPIYFINKTVAKEIYSIYKQLKTKHDIDTIHSHNLKKSRKEFLKELLLTSYWIDKENRRKPKFYDVYKAVNGEVSRLEKGDHRISGILKEMSRCILAVAGVKKQDFINSIHDELEYRKFCFEIVRCMKSRDFNNYVHCLNFVRKQFRDQFNIIDNTGMKADVKKSLLEISNKASINLSRYQESCYSSIHSAKGLEATSVLAIAYSNNELDKWLNFKAANNDLDDDYRLGYVAFSRARDMLCIACLGDVSHDLKNKLRALNIVFNPDD